MGETDPNCSPTTPLVSGSIPDKFTNIQTIGIYLFYPPPQTIWMITGKIKKLYFQDWFLSR